MEIMDETNIQQLPKDVILMMALDFDADMITSLCATSQHFNNFICKNPQFWKRKFSKEYPNLDISNVKEYTKLYSYLKNRPKFVENIRKAKPGDLFVGKLGTSILGKDNVYHNILKGQQFQAEELEKSGIKFPEFSPEYFYDFGVNHFILPRKTLTPLINKKVKINIIEGLFGEKYPVIFEKKPVYIQTYHGAGSILAIFLPGGQIYVPINERALLY